MHVLGECLRFGKLGLERDAAQALVWYRRAAAANLALAQARLGVMHQLGEGGLKRSAAAAVRLWRLAAAQGLAAAQSLLSRALMDGDGGDGKSDGGSGGGGGGGGGGGESDGDGAVARDYAAALVWARRAAAAGDAGGEVNLGLLYANGWGVPQDLREAGRCWARAAAAVGPGASEAASEAAVGNLRKLAAMRVGDGEGAAEASLRAVDALREMGCVPTAPPP
jgi:hypothetical protein